MNQKNRLERFLTEDGFNLPKVEEKILEFWRTNRIFEKSLAARAVGARKSRTSDSKPRTFIFYEGPPYANGKPGIHHILTRVFKDIILRYKTMRGYFVPRSAGWDTHGLPVEIATEKALGLASKKDIERFGIAAFNKKAQELVWTHKKEWEEMTERIGYWLDLKNAYVTCENDYIESLWWILKRLREKKLFSEGRRVVPWCPRCETALSSHELAQGYKEVEDRSVYVKFRLKPGQVVRGSKLDVRTYILSWTTTPWTLPGNVALAVGKDIEYVIVKEDRENVDVPEAWILARKIYEAPGGIFGTAAGLALRKQKIHSIDYIKGRDLIGLEYEPLFAIPKLRNEKSHRVYPAQFVTTDEGTGVVHTAVMYGEDDYELGKKAGLPEHHTVSEIGTFTKDVPDLAGLPIVRGKEKDRDTEKKIFNHLEKNGFLFRVAPHVHEYPFCWRCDTPVLYYARASWFIAMSKLRRALRAGNATINWTPAHIKEGRFGEWLKSAKDWNVSRERYWGTPLPVWKCGMCGRDETIGSVRELEARLPQNANRYILVRHGEAESNIRRRISGWPEKQAMHLTLLGRVQIERLTRKLKDEKVDYIFASDIMRTKETEKILAEAFQGEKVFFDKRLREINTGDFNGRRDSAYSSFYSSDAEKFVKRPPNGESLTDLRTRVFEFLRETDAKYKGKTIVIVSHEYPIWMMEQIMEGWSNDKAVREKEKRGEDFIKTGEARRMAFRSLPRDHTGLTDLHRPYVDAATFHCARCRGTMFRVKEIADVWFDSGAMPLAHAHFPFEKGHGLGRGAPYGIPYPADYITEAIDMTRGWFYVLLAVTTALGYKAPFKNVVCLGLVHDSSGQKMSKSRGNVIEPIPVINEHGADALRWYFYTATPPGEPKNFDEADVSKTFRRFHQIFWNCLVFYRTYAGRKAPHASSVRRNQEKQSARHKSVLDQWIQARLEETTVSVTEHLDAYDIRAAAFAIEELIHDLSRWYIRRSRRRFQKPESKSDFGAASETLRRALLEITKLIAPFCPFFAEAMYQGIQYQASGVRYQESVHLADWPIHRKSQIANRKSLCATMAEVRRLAALALAKRAEAGIKVRQPLGTLQMANGKWPASVKTSAGRQMAKDKELLELLKDEVNVKEIVFDPKLKDEIELDTHITPELREEGLIRELTRMAQELRAKAGYKPKDRIVLMMELHGDVLHAAQRQEKMLKADVNVKTIEYRRTDKFEAEEETKIESMDVWLAVRKA